MAAARQVLTHRWWRDEKKKFAIYSSQFVMDEASAGNAELAAERLRLLENIPLLPLDQLVAEIAEEIMNRAVLPEKLERMHFISQLLCANEYNTC